MAIHPNPSFPLLPSDQADVIRIFLQLMRERYPSSKVPEVAANHPSVSRNGSNRPWFPGDLPDLD